MILLLLLIRRPIITFGAPIRRFHNPKTPEKRFFGDLIFMKTKFKKEQSKDFFTPQTGPATPPGSNLSSLSLNLNISQKSLKPLNEPNLTAINQSKTIVSDQQMKNDRYDSIYNFLELYAKRIHQEGLNSKDGQAVTDAGIIEEYVKYQKGHKLKEDFDPFKDPIFNISSQDGSAHLIFRLNDPDDKTSNHSARILNQVIHSAQEVNFSKFILCDKPNTLRDRSGACVCREGYESTDSNQLGCWKCENKCTVNSHCASPALKCVCDNGYIENPLFKKDLENNYTFSCVPGPLQLVDVEPNRCTSPVCEVRVSVQFYQSISSGIAFCKFGNEAVKASVVELDYIMCSVPPQLSSKVRLSVSSNGLDWSQEHRVIGVVPSKMPSLWKVAVPVFLVVAVGIMVLQFRKQREGRMDRVEKSLKKVRNIL